MAKKNDLNNKQKELVTVENQALLLQKDYVNELETNPKYSLKADPTGEYNMTKEQKTFVEQYSQFKDIVQVADNMLIDIDTARAYYFAYSSQQEIRRINLAMYHRQFAQRMLSLDEIAGYLSSLIVDVDVPVADRLKTKEKLQVVQMLIDLNKLKLTALANPSELLDRDISGQIKNLSVTTILQLINNKDSVKEKNNIIKDINSDFLPEEQAYLRTLSTNELLTILDNQNKEVEYVEQESVEDSEHK